MTSEVQTVQLEEVADLKGGYAFKSQDYTESGRFVLRTLNIDDSGRITRDSAAYISEEKAKEYERFELVPWDTLFVMVGATLGKVGLIKESDLPALLNQNMWVVRAKKERVNPRYLHYAFGLTSKSLLGWASGAARDFVRRDDFRKMHLNLPARPQQDQIAHILGTLDDKIELNRRMNETLESIARAIFKSWFVDFDPVRAKASGEAPESICHRLGLTPDLLALFPDRLADSELGEIPEGWEQKRVDDLMELAYGKALKASDRVDGPVPVYGSGGITGYHSEHLIDGPGIIVGRKGTVGSLYWEDRSFFPIDTVFYVVPKVELTYCYYLLQTLGLDRMNTDAAVPGLNRNNVYRLLVAWSPVELRQAFDRVVKALRDRMFTKEGLHNQRRNAS